MRKRITNENDDLIDSLNDNFENLSNHVNMLSQNVEELKNKPETSKSAEDNSSESIIVNLPEDAFRDKSSSNNSEEEEVISDDENSNFADEYADDDAETEDSENLSNKSNAATKEDMQKLANYIRDEIDKSKPVIPKEIAWTLGLVCIGIMFKKYAMMLGGRNDGFR